MPTTTNSCEAYYRYLNSKILQKNLPLRKVIDIIKKRTKENQGHDDQFEMSKNRSRKVLKRKCQNNFQKL